MLYTIRPEEHTPSEIRRILGEHPEVQFVSLTGVDLAGHSTDEKIPVKRFIEDMEKTLAIGVQTDGSSVALPIIAELSNARVDILPDLDVNWFVEYNFRNINYETGLPVGTLRIPSFLRHNNDRMVGSRIFQKILTEKFKSELMRLLREHPYVFEYIDGISSVDEIEKIALTSATELEFWVKTPDDYADRDQLYTSQELKEQYWKRTIGPVGTAFEQSIEVLEHYGFEIEMGHKEVGGIKAKMGNSGKYDHIMEQLEIDWKYSDPRQAADNEIQVKHVIRDVFRLNNLDVTFLAKPMPGVAGNGEHTHLGVIAVLKDGRKVNLFTAADPTKHFMNPIGFGAIMGILGNYEILSPFVSATNDAFARLKPGFEAPVCTVTSLGTDCNTPSRNRTVLIGLVRDMGNPMSTRFELRSPHPHSNTYLLTGAAYMLMLDGIKAALINSKTPEDLEISVSKRAGEEDFYLKKNREYRSEENLFEYYTAEERDELFGRAAETVWENFRTFDENPEALEKITGGDELLNQIVSSYRAQMLSKWKMEMHDRLIPNAMEFIRKCKIRHSEAEAVDYDIMNWRRVDRLRNILGKDYIDTKSLLTQAQKALDIGDFVAASELEKEIQKELEELRDLYTHYRKNLF